jgi:hypothetical protein
MSTELWVIYGLRHVKDPYVYRYVGLTTVGIVKRFGSHTTSKDSTAKSKWLQKNIGMVVCETIEVCPEGDIDYLRSRERFWIAYYREKYGRFDSNQPNKCLNLTDGGDGTLGWVASETTRKLMSDVGKGRKFTVEHRNRISQSLKGKNTWSAGQVAHNRGIPHTEEAKNNLSMAMRGKRNPMYGRGKIVVECPHCQKMGGEAGMKVWHFDNCRLKSSM